MKFLFLLAITISSTAFAGEKYICREIGGDEYAPKKMILTQVSDESIREGKFYPFKLEIFDSGKAIVSESVNVRTEDVMFRFTNTAKKISGIIFLDELDQTSVSVGRTKYHFDCN
jgi:hypothetical protein